MLINGKRSFRGELRVPGDKSISHRALLIAALAKGKSTIAGLSTGSDVLATARAIEALGAEVSRSGEIVSVIGGLRSRDPSRSRHIDVGNSGTLMRLGAGVAAGIGGEFTFSGDESANSRPMGRVFSPLGQMGAIFRGSNNGETAPFSLTSHGLQGISYIMPVASAQVKSAILFAGLGASGETTVIETVPSRKHTEEMLKEAGARIDVKGVSHRSEITIDGGDVLDALHYNIPGDPSQAAFWIVAALVCPGSEITVRNIYLGDLRSDFLNVLVDMGGDITIDHTSDKSGDVTARSSELHATAISADQIPGIVDEIPILCVAASAASGLTTIRGAQELRVKESDRISVMARALSSFGVEVVEHADGMDIVGGTDRRPGTVSSHLDHRIAMASAILGCSVPGATNITGFETVESSYPSFMADLEKVTRN